MKSQEQARKESFRLDYLSGRGWVARWILAARSLRSRTCRFHFRLNKTLKNHKIEKTAKKTKKIRRVISSDILVYLQLSYPGSITGSSSCKYELYPVGAGQWSCVALVSLHKRQSARVWHARWLLQEQTADDPHCIRDLFQLPTSQEDFPAWP
jgi:hypothetical protein